MASDGQADRSQAGVARRKLSTAQLARARAVLAGLARDPQATSAAARSAGDFAPGVVFGGRGGRGNLLPPRRASRA